MTPRSSSPTLDFAESLYAALDDDDVTLVGGLVPLEHLPLGVGEVGVVPHHHVPVLQGVHEEAVSGYGVALVHAAAGSGGEVVAARRGVHPVRRSGDVAVGGGDAVGLLDQTLAEEKKTDATLTEIAESVVNQKAEAA